MKALTVRHPYKRYFASMIRDMNKLYNLPLKLQNDGFKVVDAIRRKAELTHNYCLHKTNLNNRMKVLTNKKTVKIIIY